MEIGKRLEAMRRAGPLVHNITNYVAMQRMADILLAAGAAPAMIHAREEAAEFARIASALTVNIGTLSPEWTAAMAEAAGAARGAGRPWVLDPVAAGATAYRREVSARLVALKPDAVKGNASEILALAGAGGAGRGVEAGDDVAAAEDAARALARLTGGIVAVTGPVDFVTDGARAFRIANGDAVMTRVTAIGCALTGVVAAFLAGEGDRLEAAAAALAYYGVAGERAAAAAAGPGDFAQRFPDALFALDGAALDRLAKVEPA
ncbi:MAG: hydroxyethylthiazole kinase [Pikeienuella sp.]|uniref:hydroxyethylthiazole kinase n=1 Tax=Pikeienuella sp. TaxID=2831957 RepID=UPI003918A79C